MPHEELEKIEKIKKVQRTDEASPLAETEEISRLPPNKERFEGFMRQDDPKMDAETLRIDTSSGRNSLLDEVRESSFKTDNLKVTPTELVAQTERAVNKIDEIKTTLAQPDMAIRQDAAPLLRNKLSHIDDNIRITLSKADLEVPEQVKAIAAPPSDNPITRFLGMLTDGQHKLQSLASEVDRWHQNKELINPATMLAIQIKVNYISQELEFFTALLNKSLESTKTIMNVQV